MSRRPIDSELFRRVLAYFPSGVTVVTTHDAGGVDHGMTVSAFCSLSLRPPLVVACIGLDATLAPWMAAAEHFGVSVLAEEQEALSRRFAEADADRFDGVGVSRGVEGVALLDGALAHLQCRVAARHGGGDHTLVVGEVLEASARDARPLLYFRSEYGRLSQ